MPTLIDHAHLARRIVLRLRDQLAADDGVFVARPDEAEFPGAPDARPVTVRVHAVDTAPAQDRVPAEADRRSAVVTIGVTVAAAATADAWDACERYTSLAAAAMQDWGEEDGTHYIACSAVAIRPLPADDDDPLIRGATVTATLDVTRLSGATVVAP